MTSLTNIYSPSAHSQGLDLSAFPQVMNFINQGKNVVNTPQAPTNIEEIQQILHSLPADQRSVVETDPSYLEHKGAVMEEFIIWAISATDIGRAYLTGVGSHKSERLLNVTKDLAAKAPKVATSEINELKEIIAQQQQMFLEQRQQIEQLSKFKAQFDEPSETTSTPNVDVANTETKESK